MRNGCRTMRWWLLLAGLLAPVTAQAKNVLESLFQAYNTYQSVNMMLWLSGDTKAEKRLGKELQWFIGLTSKREKDPELNRWANSVFDRVKLQFRDRGFNYDLQVLRDREVNAFAIPGGHVYVNRGMLEFVGSDDELAAVLAHELAHAEKRHSLKRFRTSAALQLVLQRAVKNPKDRDSWGQLFAGLTLLQFSREDEDEADDLGQERMMQAGFDPAAQVVLWQKMVAKHGKGPSGPMVWLSTHPPSEQRVENARNNLKKWNRSPVVSTNLTLSFNPLSDDRENLLPNPSFETDLNQDGIPDAWTVREGRAVRVEVADAPSGRAALRLDADTQMGEVKVVSEPITVAPGKTYRFTGRVKTEDGRQRIAVGAEVYDARDRLRGIIYPIANGVLSPAQWTKLSGQFGPGSDPRQHLAADTRKIRLLLVGGRTSKGTVWFDDLELQRSEATTANLFPDGGFETDDGQGRPVGVQGAPVVIARDLQVFKTGYASLRLSGQPDLATVQVTLGRLPREALKPGSDFQINWHHRGDDEIKARVLLEPIDANHQPILTTPPLMKEFTAKKDLWQVTGSRVRVEMTDAEYARTAGWRLNLVTDGLRAGQTLWIDGLVAR